jgi:hypothetical protein
MIRRPARTAIGTTRIARGVGSGPPADAAPAGEIVAAGLAVAAGLGDAGTVGDAAGEADAADVGAGVCVGRGPGLVVAVGFRAVAVGFAVADGVLAVGFGVGFAVAVADAIGPGVADGRAVALAPGVGAALGLGVGAALGFGVGFGVDGGPEPTTTTVPVIAGWTSQWYGNRPARVKVTRWVWPISRMPLPANSPALSGLTVCGSEPDSLRFVQVTVSPTLTWSVAGVNCQLWELVFMIETPRFAPAAAADGQVSRKAARRSATTMPNPPT